MTNNETTESHEQQADGAATAAAASMKSYELPFDVSQTPTHEALAHWARVVPNRTAFIYTDKPWKVGARSGGFMSSRRRAALLSDDQWKRISYRDFYQRVCRMRDALYQAGVPTTTTSEAGYRIIMLFLPKCRIDLMAMIVAFQATGCVPLFARPKALGGIRAWTRTMVSLNADAILCTRSVLALFNTLSRTASSNGEQRKPLQWLSGPALMKAAANPASSSNKTPADDKNSTPIQLDTAVATMFSSGTTGTPTPCIITQRMQCFQASSYHSMLCQKLGTDYGSSEIKHTNGNNNKDNPIDAPWISVHCSFTYVMLDLYLGGTAVLQPMGLAQPGFKVCPLTFQSIIQHFGAKVSSGPPALWLRLEESCPAGSLQSLKVAFCGGGETSATFARRFCDLTAAASQKEEAAVEECGLVRIYGTTQVLPIATASAATILSGEEKHRVCALGGGVCLGQGAAGVEIYIDPKAWEAKGGKSQLELSYHGAATNVAVGELCVRGEALSPTLGVADNGNSPADSSNNKPPMRVFHSGDVCYVDPVSGHLHFLGRMAQAVDCGSKLGHVAAAAVEMVCLESGAISRCAFVGPSRNGKVTPVVVIQLDKNKRDLTVVREELRAALKKSLWSELLQAGVQFVVYKKQFPVDVRSSSKVNRFFLRDWASKISSDKLQNI